MDSAQKPRHISQILLLAAAVSGAAALFFGFFYCSLYWPYRGLFNEEGRYFDEQNLVVYHEQNGLFIVPTLVCLALALLFGVVWWVRRRPVGGAAGGP